jgi:hypothetical protein
MRWLRFVALAMLCVSGWIPGWEPRAWGSVTISGTVQDSLGYGIVGVKVAARWLGGGRSYITSTGGYGGGDYTLTGIPSIVRVVVTAAPTGDMVCTFEPASYSLGELVADVTDVNFVGTIFYTIRGRTITFEGQPIANATIRAYARAGDMGEWTLYSQTTTDGNGQYSVVVPRYWTGYIDASRDGYTFSGSNEYFGIESNQDNQDFRSAPVGYTLTVDATNGSVTRSPDKATYDWGETVYLSGADGTALTRQISASRLSQEAVHTGPWRQGRMVFARSAGRRSENHGPEVTYG